MSAGAAFEYPAHRLRERALDLLFPPTCAGCGRVGRWICAECWPQTGWLQVESCSGCGRPWTILPCPHCAGSSSPLHGLIAVALFDEITRPAIHALKYHGHHAIGPTLARLMAAAVPPTTNATMVVPVSLHPRRRRERGYDQAALLAREIGRCLQLPCRPDALRRVRYTRQQATMDGAARRKNVSGAFAASEVVQGERVLLVDDVFTTGATMNAAGAAVREAGAAEVIALVFALAVPDVTAPGPRH